MADATFANDIFRQFLIERGYQLTLKAFENDIKEDKRRHIRVIILISLTEIVIYTFYC